MTVFRIIKINQGILDIKMSNNKVITARVPVIIPAIFRDKFSSKYLDEIL